MCPAKGIVKYDFIVFCSLLVECFTKYRVVKEAIRHFRALKNFQGGTKVLYNEGNFGDPLSLYLRALCCEGIFYFMSFQVIISNLQSLSHPFFLITFSY